jgi:hypothetical protein
VELSNPEVVNGPKLDHRQAAIINTAPTNVFQPLIVKIRNERK